jgi:glutamate formiminotransferase / formiminotetrahydrofolate cyclodeaminase
LCARTAVRGAYLNVQINGADFEDKARLQRFLEDGAAIAERTKQFEDQILELVEASFAEAAPA